MQALELATVPLDAARRTTLRLATRSPVLTRVLARRDSRIACLATAQVMVLFALSVWAPVALFFLGPVVFGVVHLAADVRYLALRRQPPRALLAASVVLALAITAARIGVGMHVLSARTGDRVDVLLGLVWVGVALGAGAGDRPRALLLAVAPGFVFAAWLLVARAHAVNLALVHVHNLVAVLAWLFLFRRRRRWAALPVALAVGFSAVLLSGALLPWTFAHGGFSAFGVTSTQLSAWLAPGARGDLGLALTTSFVFLQGVHYAAWTSWIPQDALPAEGTPTFRMSIRALIKDFGRVALGCVALAAVAFAGLAVWNVRESIAWYMTIAKSHAWFELAFLAYFAVRQECRAVAR